MTQPTFPDGPPVPLMVDGVIDAATLRQLFADLAASATVLGVREKSGPTAYTGADEQTTQTALARLLSGSARAAQVRYRFDNHEWTDTILSVQNGFRVVRCRHESES
ncbi:MAG TPA: hypothetical protein VMZ71_04235 [Gemmataceae bacterium]|nr:hypothetical protein [Gemmataceae bacterium]